LHIVQTPQKSAESWVTVTQVGVMQKVAITCGGPMHPPRFG